MAYPITVWFLPKFLNFSTLGCAMNSDHYTLELLYYKCQHTLKVSTPAGPPCITGLRAPTKVKGQIATAPDTALPQLLRPVFYFCNHSCCPSEYACPIPELRIFLIVSSLACLLPSFLVYAFPGYIGQLSEF